MTQETVILDSSVFDRLIQLSAYELSAIRSRYRFTTTDVSLKELKRIGSEEKRKRILDLAVTCDIINAKIFGFLDYSGRPVEDSLGGFATYASQNSGGRMLTYKDLDVLKVIGTERNKKSRGRSGNDAAIALAIVHSHALGVVEDQKLRNRLKRLGAHIMSFDEFRTSVLGPTR